MIAVGGKDFMSYVSEQLEKVIQKNHRTKYNKGVQAYCNKGKVIFLDIYFFQIVYEMFDLASN